MARKSKDYDEYDELEEAEDEYDDYEDYEDEWDKEEEEEEEEREGFMSRVSGFWSRLFGRDRDDAEEEDDYEKLFYSKESASMSPEELLGMLDQKVRMIRMERN